MGTSVSLGSSQAQGRGSALLRTPDWLAVAYPPFGQTISYAKCNGNHDQSAYSIPSMREHSDSIKCEMWHCGHYAGCLLFDWQCEKKIIVSLSTKYWWLVNSPPPPPPPPCPVKQVLTIICVTFLLSSAIMPTLE